MIHATPFSPGGCIRRQPALPSCLPPSGGLAKRDGRGRPLPSHQGAPLTPASQRLGALASLGRAQPGSAIAVRPCRFSTLRAAPDQAVRPPFPLVINRRAESDQARRVETRSGSMRSTPSAYPARTAEPGRRRKAGASQTRHLRRSKGNDHHRPAQAQARKQHRPTKFSPARQGGARRAPLGLTLFFPLVAD